MLKKDWSRQNTCFFFPKNILWEAPYPLDTTSSNGQSWQQSPRALCCLQPWSVDINFHQRLQRELGQLKWQSPSERQWALPTYLLKLPAQLSLGSTSGHTQVHLCQFGVEGSWPMLVYLDTGIVPVCSPAVPPDGGRLNLKLPAVHIIAHYV